METMFYSWALFLEPLGNTCEEGTWSGDYALSRKSGIAILLLWAPHWPGSGIPLSEGGCQLKALAWATFPSAWF